METFSEKLAKEKMDYIYKIQRLRKNKDLYNKYYEISEELLTNFSEIVDMNIPSSCLYLDITCSKDFDLFKLEDLLDFLEKNSLKDFNFKDAVDLESFKRYIYTSKDKAIIIKLDFYPAECKIIKTGNLIEETKTICSFSTD